MKPSRTYAFVGAALAAGLLLSGCSAPADLETPDETITESEAPEATPTQEAPATPSEPGALTEPGSTIALGEWASYEFTGTDKQKAVVSARLVSVEPASQADTDFLVDQIPQLKGYEVVLLTVEQKKVSGESIAFNADYTGFRPASADGKRAQEVTVIGWDTCRSNSFSKDFDENGATITQCIIGAAVPGGNPIAGVIYAPYDSPYSTSGGQPIFFTK